MTYRALVLFTALFLPAVAYAAPTSLSVLDSAGVARTIPAEGTLSAPIPHSVPDVNGTAVGSGNPLPVVQTGTPALPTGAATAANQPTINADGGAQSHIMNFPSTQAVTATALPLPTGAATAANQTPSVAAGTSATSGMPIQGVAGGVAVPVSNASLPLPTGAATASNQVKQVLTSYGVNQVGGGALTISNTTTNYATNTVIGGDIVFPNAVATAGGCVDINNFKLQPNTLGLNASLVMYLFSVPLSTTNADNVALALPTADIVGAILLSSADWHSLGSGGSVVRSMDTSQSICNGNGGTSLYGLLVTASALTTTFAANDFAGRVAIVTVSK